MRITNRRAYSEYAILEKLEVGIQLTGSEVKSVKEGRIQLDNAFVRLMGDEAYLVNAEIPPYSFARNESYDPRRTRKLLLHKSEITSLKTKITQGKLTLVPLACYNKGAFLKLEIGLARGKRQYEKREELRRRDIDREVERELRGKT